MITKTVSKSKPKRLSNLSGFSASIPTYPHSYPEVTNLKSERKDYDKQVVYVDAWSLAYGGEN